MDGWMDGEKKNPKSATTREEDRYLLWHFPPSSQSVILWKRYWQIASKGRKRNANLDLVIFAAVFDFVTSVQEDLFIVTAVLIELPEGPKPSYSQPMIWPTITPCWSQWKTWTGVSNTATLAQLLTSWKLKKTKTHLIGQKI